MRAVSMRANVDRVNPARMYGGDIRLVEFAREKTRHRDTRLGQWLTDQAPTVLDAVGDVLPERGVLGIVKNLVEREPDLTHDQRMRFERLYG